MLDRLVLSLLLTVSTLHLLGLPGWPHGGGLDSFGCHHNHIQGGYHCHQGMFRGAMFDSKVEMFQVMEQSTRRQAQGQESEGRASGTVPLTMEVTLVTPAKDQYALQVRLTNRNRGSVFVDRYALPWRFLNTTLAISATSLDEGRTSLIQMIAFVDYAAEMIEVKPGEVLEGLVDLNGTFDELLKEVRSYGVMVQWQCQVEGIPVVCLVGEGGTFSIPKGGLRPGEAKE